MLHRIGGQRRPRQRNSLRPLPRRPCRHLALLPGAFGEGAQALLHGGAVQVAQDEHQPGPLVIALRPGGQLHRRVEQVLHAMDGDRPVLAFEFRMPLIRSTLSPRVMVSTSSQVAKPSQGSGSSKVRQKARMRASCRLTS